MTSIALWIRPLLRGTLLLGLVACSPHLPPAARAPSPSPSAPATPAAASDGQASASAGLAPSGVAPEDLGDALIVGGMEGLFAVSRQGGGSRLLSAGPALEPRTLSKDGVLVIRPRRGDGLARGARLERVSLSDGKRTTLAKLPAFGCEEWTQGEFGFDLHVHRPEDFAVTEDEQGACLQLMDRNLNMANLILDVAVDLRSGEVQRYMRFGDDECTPPRDVVTGQDASGGACAQPERAVPEPVAKRGSYPYTFRAGHVIDVAHGGKKLLRLPGFYEVESTSGSGRWLVLGGDEEEGDYIYRRLVLLDRQEGALYPVGEQAGPWPQAIARAGETLRTLPKPIEQAALVPGETEVRWLEGATGDLLVVGSLVLPPGEPSFEVPGGIAR